MDGIISSETFIPHTLAHLTEKRVFPQPLPEVFYAKLETEYAEINDVDTQAITYESDGLRVTGLTCFPKNQPAAQLPILIYNRGGNREYGKLTLLSVMRSMVPFARAGYLVYASNYRGNGGGEGQEEFGGADVNDIVNLAAIAKTHPGWDGRNLFLIGHSRGGMMTALALKAGLAANAAVAIAGISDAREFMDRKTMVENVFKKRIPGYEFNPQAALEARSPVCWPEAISAPLLLIHGDADKDVPPTHSTRLAVALARLQKPHELVIYEGGNHALLRHWDSVLERCLGWMLRHKNLSEAA
jgi:dipeptidyl aminopeptidase/acylaminoacyl peptidase